MRTAKEFVQEINTAKPTAPCYVEDAVDIEDAKEVDTIDIDEHRWYNIGTVVYRVGEEFFGVRGAVHLNSESMSWSDTGVDVEAFEMVEVPSVTYKRK